MATGRLRDDAALQTAPRRRQGHDQGGGRLAGVSAMTVSNVFNGTGKFSRETALIEVMAAIEGAGLRAQLGRAAAGGRFTPAWVGLLYAGVDSMFIDGVLAAAAVASAERGLQLMARKAGSPEDALETARALQRSAPTPCCCCRRSTWS